MNNSGIHDPDEEIRYRFQEFLDKLGIMDDSLAFRVEALNRALSAGLNNFDGPNTLIVDPNTWNSLKNLTFDDKNLKP